MCEHVYVSVCVWSPSHQSVTLETCQSKQSSANRRGGAGGAAPGGEVSPIYLLEVCEEHTHAFSVVCCDDITE